MSAEVLDEASRKINDFKAEVSNSSGEEVTPMAEKMEYYTRRSHEVRSSPQGMMLGC